MVEFNIEDGMNEDAVEPSWPDPVVEAALDETPLFELKTRRDKISKELVKSFQVARWENPEVYCEFSIIEPSVLSKAIQKREKQKNRADDWVAWAYCDVLAPACTRVYATMDSSPNVEFSLRRGDPNGTHTRIDHDLAKALGLDPADSSAADTFRRLFFSEGDLIDLANRVFRWSAVVGEEADETF